VRDGGGITPDTIVEAKTFPAILYYLVMDNVVFDFVTQWAADKKEIDVPEAFTITDVDYEAFKAFVKQSDFTYDRQSEKVLNNLKEVAEVEGYMDTAKEEFAALEAKLKPDLDRDLEKFKPLVVDQLNGEIVTRFYYQKGRVVNLLRNDAQLNSAIDLLKDNAAYKTLLSPPAAE